MSTRTSPATSARHGVGIGLIRGEEAAAIRDQLLRTQPQVEIADRGVYLKAAAAEEIVIDLADLSERLGRALTIEDVLIVVASYFGEIDPQRGSGPGSGRLILRAENLTAVSEPEKNSR